MREHPSYLAMKMAVFNRQVWIYIRDVNTIKVCTFMVKAGRKEVRRSDIESDY